MRLLGLIRSHVYDGAHGTLPDGGAAVAQDIAEAVITHLTSDDAIERFRAEWEQADSEGDVGNRVRRGMHAALRAVTDERPLSAVILNGPHEGVVFHPQHTPLTIVIGSETYSLITDPDTGVGLGGYVHEKGARS